MELNQNRKRMLKNTGIWTFLCVCAVLFNGSASLGQENEAKASASNEAKAVSSQEIKATELNEREDLLRQEAFERARGYFDRARASFELNSDFETAEQNYNKAMSELEKSRGVAADAGQFSENVQGLQDEIEKNLVKLNIRWANRLISEAIREANEAKTEEAEEKLAKAESFPKLTVSDKDRIAKLRKQMDMKKTEIRFAEETKVSEIIQDKAEDDLRVKIMLEKGRVLLQNSRFGDARDIFEQVLLRDPTNLAAIRYLSRVNQAQEKAADEKLKTLLHERIAEVRWKWAEPVTPILDGAGADAGVKPIEKGGMAVTLESKLESIILPEVRYNETPLIDVLKKLRLESVNYDTEDNEGVSIIPNLKLRATTKDKASAIVERSSSENDFSGDFGSQGDSDAGGGDFAEDLGAAKSGGADADSVADDLEQEPVTLEIRNVRLIDVIKYVCMVTGAVWKIDGTAVVVSHPKNEDYQLETRFYDVEAGVFDVKATRKKPDALTLSDDDDDEDEEDEDEDDTEASSGTGSEDKDFLDKRGVFTSMGVEFPPRARLTYYARLGKLISYNTPDNHLKIERLLQEINKWPTLVSIEAKVVEIEQTNLDTLGFEWSLAAGTKSMSLNDNGKPYLTREGDMGRANNSKFQIGVNKGFTTITNGLRFAAEYFGDATEDSLLGVYTVLGNYAFNTVLHAIEQEGINNVLSAPKVTTISGQTAIIKVVTRRKFPEDWEEPEFESTGTDGGYTYKPATPNFDEEEELGVQLYVTPVVAPDKFSIYLDLEPSVTQFLGYDTSFNTTQIVEGRELEMKNGMMAILSARKVRTRVVVWDGETIVLGGMIKEEHLKFEDRVPLLGRIPVLGRLFTSTGEKSIKTNTLIFVSARVVQANGVPERVGDMRGLPDFRH